MLISQENDLRVFTKEIKIDILRGFTPSFFMKEVKIVDNFLTQEEFSNIWNYIQSMTWEKQTSEGKKSIIDFLSSDVSNVEYFNHYLFEKVRDTLGINVELSRVYFNGQWHGREGDLHTDGCDITSLIYLSQYRPEWGGFTQLFLDNDEEVIVSPHEGRMICFPGMCLHKGYSYAYQTCPMRISLAYKMFLC